jgi:hypothetical protein
MSKEYINRELLENALEDENKNGNFVFTANWIMEIVDNLPTADVVPKSEVEKIFEKLKARECSNSVCAWCVHATDYGRRNEECDKPYIDKNGKEQKACYAYAKFESLIDNELAELKKKYTEGKE